MAANETLSTRCGYIALLGQPNAGKSTLLNACVGQKLAGVSRKPQTTRNRIVGIALQEKAQLVFLDTPGIHKSTGKVQLNRMMNQEAWATLADADFVCYLVDLTKGWTEDDKVFLTGVLEKTTSPVLLLLSKSDKIKKFEFKNILKALSVQLGELSEDLRAKLHPKGPMVISSKVKEEVDALKRLIAQDLPQGPWLFPEDDLTDRPQKFIFSELIREQIFRRFSQEIPYQCGVVIDKVTETPKIVKILATIIVSRESHKPMLIGRGGSILKDLGTEAREAIEKNLGVKVFLQLHVEVDEDWINKTSQIATYQGLT